MSRQLLLKIMTSIYLHKTDYMLDKNTTLGEIVPKNYEIANHAQSGRILKKVDKYGFQVMQIFVYKKEKGQ